MAHGSRAARCVFRTQLWSSFGGFLSRYYQSTLCHAVSCYFCLRKTCQIYGVLCFISIAGVVQSHAAAAFDQSRVPREFGEYLQRWGGQGRQGLRAGHMLCKCCLREISSTLCLSVQHCKVRYSELASGCAELCVAGDHGAHVQGDDGSLRYLSLTRPSCVAQCCFSPSSPSAVFVCSPIPPRRILRS